MSPAEKQGEAELGRLIGDAFDHACLDEMRAVVLQRALDQAQLRDIPNTLEDLTFFVSGPLYEHAQRAFGDAFADRLLVAINPVLDRAWELDRNGLNEVASSAETPTSAIRAKRSRSAIRRMQPDDAPPSAIDVVHDTVPVRDTDVAPRSSRRNTMPYLESVLAEDNSRALIAHADDDRRRMLASVLEAAGHKVVTAHDARVAAMLIARVHPSVIVADVETIAPDFEPLGPALETLFGGQDEVPVVLLSDHRRPALPDCVKAIVAATSTPNDVLAVIERMGD